jgi:hypothetical protein
MSYNARVRNGDAATAATAMTGSAPQTLNGSALYLQQCAQGAEIVCKFTMVVRTSSLTMTPSIQVSANGTDWDTLVAGSATSAGTGTAVTTTTLLKTNLPPYRCVRGVVVTASATATSSDTAAIEWNYLRGTAEG